MNKINRSSFIRKFCTSPRFSYYLGNKRIIAPILIVAIKKTLVASSMTTAPMVTNKCLGSRNFSPLGCF